VRLKATHKISPLEELVGGRSPPSSSQRLTGMMVVHIFKFCTFYFNYQSGNYFYIILSDLFYFVDGYIVSMVDNNHKLL
jgi:hypothetical protein